MVPPPPRPCNRCGKPAVRFTFRPREAPPYQEWCAEHAPEDAQLFHQEPAAERTIHDQTIEPGPAAQ